MPAADDCTGRPDFTPCEVVTSPDFSRDICIAGRCVSPGTCGDSSCNVTGPHFRLPDTNRRSCFGQTEGRIPCPGTPGEPSCGSTPYCGQDAQYGWDTSHLPSERFTRSRGVPNEPLVEDNVTGLVWQGCTAGQGGPDCVGQATAMSWSAALDYCDSLEWGGESDWYLPDEFELQSIMDFERTSPAIDPGSFPNTPADRWWDDWYWSSSSHDVFPDQAWTVHSASADVFGEDKAGEGYVRCARSSQLGALVRFEREEGATGQVLVADSVTGLDWQGCAAGLSGGDCSEGEAAIYDWSASLAYCEDLSWGGATDWRLPNVIELRSIVDNRRSDPAVDVQAFPNTPYSRLDWPHGRFWSSTPRGYRNFGLYVGFLDGNAHFYKMEEERHVRCVRGEGRAAPEPTPQEPTATATSAASATSTPTRPSTPTPTYSQPSTSTPTPTATATPGAEEQPSLYVPMLVKLLVW